MRKEYLIPPASSLRKHSDLMLLCTFKEFPQFWADETATDVQWKKFSATESFMQKRATMQLYFLSAPLKITPHMSVGNILCLGENICTSRRPSVWWKRQIRGRKSRIKHFFSYQFPLLIAELAVFHENAVQLSIRSRHHICCTYHGWGELHLLPSKLEIPEWRQWSWASERYFQQLRKYYSSPKTTLISEFTLYSLWAPKA